MITLAPTPLPGCCIIRPQRHDDARGSFTELFHATDWRDHGLDFSVAQINQSTSHTGVVRGLHVQWDAPMAKAMRVVAGRALLLAVDIRLGSPTFGRHVAQVFSGDDLAYLFAPAGFARGLCALEDHSVVQYLCDTTYNPRGEGGIRWDDPALAIDWPVIQPMVSDKDRCAPTLAQWAESPQARHFVYP